MKCHALGCKNHDHTGVMSRGVYPWFESNEVYSGYESLDVWIDQINCVMVRLIARTSRPDTSMDGFDSDLASAGEFPVGSGSIRS